MSEQSQSNRFGAHLLMCLPEMTVEQRQAWIGDPKRTKRLLSALVRECWGEENGIITFTLPPTTGVTGPEWFGRIQNRGRVGHCVEQILLSPDFRSTTGVIYTVKVLRGELISGKSSIGLVQIQANALSLGQLNAEAACLIREKFTDEEIELMGLHGIFVMHEPIKDASGEPRMLGIDRFSRTLLTAYGVTDMSGQGLAFAAPQVTQA